jgi:hypothetical protein
MSKIPTGYLDIFTVNWQSTAIHISDGETTVLTSDKQQVIVRAP